MAEDFEDAPDLTDDDDGGAFEPADEGGVEEDMTDNDEGAPEAD